MLRTNENTVTEVNTKEHETTQMINNFGSVTTEGIASSERISRQFDFTDYFTAIKTDTTEVTEVITESSLTTEAEAIEISESNSFALDQTSPVLKTADASSEETTSSISSQVIRSTTQSTTQTSNSPSTSAHDLPFTSDVADFTSNKEQVFSTRDTDFTRSLSSEIESTSLDTSTPSSYSTVTETSDVPLHSTTGELIKINSTHQPLSSLKITETTVSVVDVESNTTEGIATTETTDADATVLSTVQENSTTKVQNISCFCGNCSVKNTEDCTKYFECVNNEYVAKQCEVGYLFSSTLERCEMAEDIKCAQQSNQCLSDDGFFADVNDCSSYVQCYHGISYKKTCSKGLFYNPVKRTCDVKSNCGIKSVLPTSRNMDIECDCDYCIMGDSDDCSKYYLCLDGAAYEEMCSHGLRFNPETATCDYEENVACTSPSPECKSKTGNFSFPGSCASYYHCVGGVAYNKECDPGFHFSTRTGQCEEPCEAGCDSSLECPITSMMPICQERDDLFPNPDDCHTFYECSGGKPKLAECTDEDHFNAVSQICEDPCQAKCDLSLDCFNSTSALTNPGQTISAASLITSAETKGFDPTDVTSTIESMATESASSSDGISIDFTPSETVPDELVTESTSRTTRYVSSLNLFSDETFEMPTTTYSALCLEPTGVYPVPEECGALVLCIDGYPMKLYCDDHLHFNPSTKRCESPCSASCDPFLDCSTTEEPDLPTPLPLSLCWTRDFLPKRGHCKYYYDCTQGKLRRKKTCPKGLHFNPTKRVCDSPQKSGCGEPANDLPIPDLHYKCPCEACLLPSAHNFLEYFLCLNFTAYRLKCSDGLLFDENKKTCNFANRVKCDSSVTMTSTPYPSKEETYETTTGPSYTTKTSETTTSYTTSQPDTNTEQVYTTSTVKPSYTKSTTSRPYTTSTTTSRPYTTSTTTSRPYTTIKSTNKPRTTISPTTSHFRCPEASGMFRNPKDCGSFIHCSNFKPYFKECPDGLHFSVETKRCEYPCDSKCDESLPCVSSIPPTTANPLCQCRNCLLPNPESCTKFFECKDGQPMEKNCPRGQTFDTRRSRCDWAHRVNCLHSEICPKRNGLFPYKGDCRKFVHCSNGIPHTKVCPPRLQFDPKTLRCTFAPGPCGSTLSMNGTKNKSKLPAPGVPQWHCPSSFGYYRSDQKCNQYYHCSEGVAILKKCAEGLYFNSKYGTCDWPKNVNCRTDESRLERRCRHFIDFQCPSNRSYVAYSHCDMFFDCRTGKACTKRCPDGLYFNSETSMCDLPTNVKCRKSDGESYSLKKFAEICKRGYKQHAVDPATNKCYYKCQHDKLNRFCCSASQLYNNKRGRCERRTVFSLPFEEV